MTIPNQPAPAAGAELSLKAFHEGALQGEALQLVHEDAAWKVQAAGPGPAPRADVDTTSAFMAALGRAFSPRIQDAVARELELAPRPGEPLASRLVLRAIAMAETSRKALEGVDFMTRLMVGASTQSAGFVGACRALGLSPQAFDAPQRAAIDAAMQQRFAQALHQGRSPVAPELAQQWLRAELAALQA